MVFNEHMAHQMGRQVGNYVLIIKETCFPQQLASRTSHEKNMALRLIVSCKEYQVVSMHDVQI